MPLYNLPYLEGFSSRGKNNSRSSPKDDYPVDANGCYTTVDGVPVRKLFVTNLTKQTMDKELILPFSRFGKVIEAFIVRSSNPGKPSFGFVTFENPKHATSALRNRKSIYINRRKIFISPADSWHQPLQLGNGELILNRKKYENGRREPDLTDEQQECLEGEPEFSPGDFEYLKPDDSCAISKLNDDCLLLIFELLPICDKVSIHKVCRRWQTVIMPTWYAMKSLDFSIEPLSKTVLNDKLLDSLLSLCPNSTSINLGFSENLSPNALVLIAKKCPHLEEITMRMPRMKKRALAFFAKSCPKLKSLRLDACSNFYDGELSGLMNHCKNLESIALKYCSASPGLWLKNLQSPLKSLYLEMYYFDPENLMLGINRAKDSLRELNFVYCDSLRSRDIASISRIVPDLTQLTVAGGSLDFSRNSLFPIAKFEKLVHLDLHRNQYVCDQFLDELSQNCQSLETFIISGINSSHLTDIGLNNISKIIGLKYLGLGGVQKLTDSNLKFISKNLKGLKHLVVMACSAITDVGCQSIINNCNDLEILDVRGCSRVTNQTVITAAEKTRGTNQKLRIMIADSDIDLDIECPPSVILDSTTVVTQLSRIIGKNHQPTLFIHCPDLETVRDDDELFFDYLSFLDDDLDDNLSQDDFDFDYMVFDEDGHAVFNFNDDFEDSDATYDDYCDELF